MVITIIGMIIITTGQCPMKAVFNGCYKRKTSFAPWSSVSTDGQILLVSTDGLILSVSADGRILLSWIEHNKLWIRFFWILLIICSAKFFYFWARSNSHCGVCIITCNGTFRLLRMCTSFLLRIKPLDSNVMFAALSFAFVVVVSYSQRYVLPSAHLFFSGSNVVFAVFFAFVVVVVVYEPSQLVCEIPEAQNIKGTQSSLLEINHNRMFRLLCMCTSFLGNIRCCCCSCFGCCCCHFLKGLCLCSVHLRKI